MLHPEGLTGRLTIRFWAGVSPVWTGPLLGRHTHRTMMHVPGVGRSVDSVDGVDQTSHHS
jgi:hypothetical protein